MDASYFDRFTRFLAARTTRRATVASGVGAAAVAFGAGPARTYATARAATPVAGQDAGAKPLFLYVQTFGGGTLAPLDADPDRYLLTLTDAPVLTMVFADHPSRETNLLPTERLPDVLAFTEANPPNAALVSRTDDGEEIVLVIELLEPTYDPGTRTVTYEVAELAEYATFGDEIAARAQPLGSMPSSFGITNLFIDSGGDGESCSETSCDDDEVCANGICQCADWTQDCSRFGEGCVPLCSTDTDYYRDRMTTCMQNPPEGNDPYLYCSAWVGCAGTLSTLYGNLTLGCRGEDGND